MGQNDPVMQILPCYGKGFNQKGKVYAPVDGIGIHEGLKIPPCIEESFSNTIS